VPVRLWCGNDFHAFTAIHALLEVNNGILARIKNMSEECLIQDSLENISVYTESSSGTAVPDVLHNSSVITSVRESNSSAVYDLWLSRRWVGTILYSGMLCRLAVVKTDVSEELSAPIIRVTIIGELGITLAVYLRSERRLLVTPNVVLSSSIFVTMMIEVLHSSEMSVLTRATRRNISVFFNSKSLLVTEQWRPIFVFPVR
jgi:hypothetical protein